MKFKVFDKEIEKFSYPGNLVLKCDGELDSPYQWFPKNRFIPVFSTGQKDIDGNEIYEGDVIEFEFTSNNNKIGYVHFVKGTYYLTIPNDTMSIPDIRLRLVGVLGEGTAKIIGSKYTNPELLEEEC